MVNWGRLSKQVTSAFRNPNRSWHRLRTKLGLGLRRWHLQFLHRQRGQTLWLRRGGYWLPFHGDDDLQELQYLYFGEVWFAAESQRLGPWLQPGAVVIDVGANLGFISLVLARHVGAQGRIYAFEPSPLVYPKLLEVLSKNEVRNAQCFQRGCGAERRTATLLVPESSGNATIQRPAERPEGPLREVMIEIDTLDAMILPQISRLDLLKIDTEGFEDQVLAGARELVEQHRPLIYIELSQEYADSSARAVAWLEARGYKFDQEVDLANVRNGDNFLALP
jgi:FkbM family methyltransferase